MDLAEIEKAVRRNFPLKKPRDHQIETIINICYELLVNQTRHVFLSAPTGSGKSVIAYTVALTVKELFDWGTSKYKFGQNYDHKTTIITSNKNLQRQYIDDFPIVNLWGKTAYSCHQGTHYDTSDCYMAVTEGRCDKGSQCPYYINRNIWLDSQTRLTNSSFQIEACDMISNLASNRAALMIIDECHTLGEKIQGHCTVKFDTADLKKHEQWFRKAEYAELMANIQTIDRKIQEYKNEDDVVKFPATDQKFFLEFVAQLEGAYKRLKGMRDNLDSKKEATKVRSISEAIGFAGEYSDMCEVLEQNLDKPVLWDEGRLRPIYPGSFARYALYRKSHQFLHMSATICDPDSYGSEVGVKDYVYFEMPNPIPPENRQVICSSIQKVSNGEIDQDMMTVIDKIIDEHEGENGVIHTVSYSRAEEIKTKSFCKDRMFISSDKDEIMETLGEGEGKVLLSPVVVEGFDLKDDLARFQIIPKVPYGSIDDKLNKLIFKMNKSLYFRRTVLKVVQSSGRSSRHETDKSTIYILDSAFYDLYKYNKKLFPDWYRQSMTFKNKAAWGPLK